MRRGGLPSLASAVQRWRDRPAVTAGDQDWTYGDLGARMASLAEAYRRWGIRRGDRIVCQLPTSPEFLVAVGAAWACGAVQVGASHDLSGPELARLVARTEAAALLYQPHPVSGDPLGPLATVRDASPETRLVVHGAHSSGRHTTLASLLEEPARTLDDPPFGNDEEAALFLTSGTTGEPKGVVETLPALWAKMAHFAESYVPRCDDTHLHALPLAHAFGLKLALTALTTGGRLVTMPRFSPTEALRLITVERATILPGTPSHLRLLLDRFDPARHDVGALRWVVTAAAPLPPGLAETVCQAFDARMFHVYGCSEGFLVTSTNLDDVARGSAGRCVFAGPEGTSPDGEIAVFDPEGDRLLAAGEVGELVFGARRPVRYVGASPVASDGWYRSGDLGTIDPDGRVFVLGRVKDLINRGGQKIAPGEVESELARHSEVADCAVASVADRVLGEAVCACIVPAGDHTPDLAEVRSFLSDKVARHKLPDELCVVSAVPRHQLGKIDRAELQSLLAADPPRQQLRASAAAAERGVDS